MKRYNFTFITKVDGFELLHSVHVSKLFLKLNYTTKREFISNLRETNGYVKGSLMEHTEEWVTTNKPIAEASVFTVKDMKR